MACPYVCLPQHEPHSSRNEEGQDAQGADFWVMGERGAEAWSNIKDGTHSCLLLIIIIPFCFLSS